MDVFRPSNPLELAKSFVGAKELGKMLVDCVGQVWHFVILYSFICHLNLHSIGCFDIFTKTVWQGAWLRNDMAVSLWCSVQTLMAVL